MDINTKLLKKNAFRITKTRGKTAIRIRVPGGQIEAKHLEVLQKVAEIYGDGTLHINYKTGF